MPENTSVFVQYFDDDLMINVARQIHKCTHSEGPFYQDTVTTSGLRKSADKTKF